MCFRVGWILLLLLAGAGPSSAWAQSSTGPGGAAGAPRTGRSARVLLLSSGQAEWVERVRGQLGDIDATLSVSAASPEGSLASQLERARQLGGEQGADVVAWLALDLEPAGGSARGESASGAYVLVWSAPTEQHYARRLGERWHRLSPGDQSAALEVGALTVRSAVRSLALDASDEPSSEAPPAPLAPDASLPNPSLSGPEELSPAWGWHAGVSYDWQLDGQTAWGLSSLDARAGVHRGAWSGSLLGGWGLPASIDAAGAELELRRHVVWLEGAHTPVSRSTFSAAALLRVGMSFGRRETRATSSELLATRPQSDRSMCVGAGLRGALHLGGSQSLTLALTGTWLPTAPRYVIEDPTNDRRLEYPLWNVQPSLELGWVYSR